MLRLSRFTTADDSRENAEIDYCPKFRGAWLDRGELDRIIEQSQREVAGSASPPGQPFAPLAPNPGPGYAYGAGRRGFGHGRSRHGGFLKRLFD